MVDSRGPHPIDFTTSKRCCTALRTSVLEPADTSLEYNVFPHSKMRGARPLSNQPVVSASGSTGVQLNPAQTCLVPQTYNVPLTLVKKDNVPVGDGCLDADVAAASDMPTRPRAPQKRASKKD